MRRVVLSLLALVLVAPLMLVLAANPSGAVAAGSDPGRPTPYVPTPDDLGPVAQGHPESQPCLTGSTAIAVPVLDRTAVVMTCGLRGSGPQSVFAALLEADGTRSEPWALVGASGSPGLVVRDIAVDPQAGDVGIALGLPGGALAGLGLARYDAASATWTSLTSQAVAQGVKAPCVDPSFSGALELGALMKGGVLSVVAPFSREVTTSVPPFVATGEIMVLRSRWSGSGCSPGFDAWPIDSGPDLAPQTGDNSVMDLDVSQVPGAEDVVITLNRSHGTTSWSDDTYDVLLVDPSDGTHKALINDAVGRAVAVDLVEDPSGAAALVSRLVSGSASVLAVPLNGDAPAVVPSAQSAMGFVDPDPSFSDAGAIPVAADKVNVVSRSAVVLHDSSRVAYSGAAGPPFDRPRTPVVRMAWHDSAQPGGLRVVAMPTSSIEDPVHWRIPDMTNLRVVIREGTPVLTAPCGLDTSARLWWCVSSWSQATGWSPPAAVRFAVRPSWPVTGGSSPRLVAGVTAGGVRLVERDVAAPTLALTSDSDQTFAAGSIVAGSLVATDDNDGPEVACRVAVDGSEVASSAIPPLDDMQYFPAAVVGEQTLPWTTSPLSPGAHEVRASCTDRAGNVSTEKSLQFEVALLPAAAPGSVVAKPRSAGADISWTAPSADVDRAVPTTYRVIVSDPRAHVQSVACVASTSSCRVTGLDNGITYWMRVQSMAADTAGGRSGWVTVRPISAPTSPRALAVTWRSGGRALVCWTSSATKAAPVSEHRVLVNGQVKGTVPLGAPTCLMVAGQRQAAKYTFAVQAVNPLGRATATLGPLTRLVP